MADSRFGDMGEVCVLRGMKVSVYTKGEERHRPHFHVYYREGRGLGRGAQVEIDTGRVTAGTLPAKAQRMVMRWLAQPGVRAALHENWKRALAGKATFRIPTYGSR